MSKPSESSIGLAAQCWCDKETEGIEMDIRLAMAFAKRFDDLINSCAALAAELELSKLTVLAVSKNNLAISAENEKLKTDKIRLMRDMGIHVSNIEKLRAANAELVEALKQIRDLTDDSHWEVAKEALAKHGGKP